MPASNDSIEAKRKARDDQFQQLTFIYANAGKQVLDPQTFALIEKALLALPNEPRVDVILHDLSRTKHWLEHNRGQWQQLRREYLQAKLDAGEFVSPHALQSAGLTECTG